MLPYSILPFLLLFIFYLIFFDIFALFFKTGSYFITKVDSELVAILLASVS